MILLSLLFQTLFADLLFSNQYNSSFGIQSIEITNFCKKLDESHKLSVTLTQQSKQSPLLVVCGLKLEDIETFQKLLDNDNFEQSDCLIDYNGYSFQTQTQQITMTHRTVPTQVQLTHNVYSIQDNSCFIMVYSSAESSYVVTIESVSDNSCARYSIIIRLRKCKNQGNCVNGYCQCPIGCLGSDCGILASNIDNNNYFQGAQLFYLDLITLQSSSFIEQLNSDLNLTISCYYQNPHLHLPLNPNNTLYIDQNQIQECKQFTQALHYNTKLQYFPQFVFITSTQQIVQVVFPQESSGLAIQLIATIFSIVGFIFLLSLILYCCKKKNEQVKKEIKVQVENLMPAFQFISVTDRLPNSRGEQQQCSICLEKFQSDSIVRMTYCEHVFHAKCLQSWIKKNKNCPLCRAQLDTQTIKSKAKIDNKTNLQQQSQNILQQLSVFQKHDGSLTSIDGSLAHSPIVDAQKGKPHGVSKFALN